MSDEERTDRERWEEYLDRGGRKVQPGPPELLTDGEHRAMALTAELVNLLASEVIGRERSRAGDVAEVVAHVHGIQHMILSQAAARAYPDRYRLLGEVLDDHR